MPQPFSCLSDFSFQSHHLLIGWRILPIPPVPAVLDQCVIDVRAIGHEHIGNGALVLVETLRLLKGFEMAVVGHYRVSDDADLP